MTAERHFIAAKGFVERDGKILLLRESNRYADGLHSGYYDVPGGRLKKDEDLLTGLAREIMEETGLVLTDAVPFFMGDRTVNKGMETWHITRHFFICRVSPGAVRLGPDHDDALWTDPQDLTSVNIIPDLIDVFAAYNKARSFS